MTTIIAQVYINQHEDGTLLFSRTFFIRDDYVEFRNEFNQARFDGITKYGYERWITADNLKLLWR